MYPLGFVGSDTTGADRSPTLRLLDLIPWLDHLLDLGANGLILGPVFASSSHGYDTIDWFTVDPRLGSEVELVTLMDAAHARGIKIMLDGVFNHVGPEYAPLISVRDNLAAENTDLFRLEADGSFATFEGHGGLIALNHASPEVARTVSDVLSYWAERGADAWRLDAAYAVPSTFWATVLSPLRICHPDMYIVGEVLHGDYVAAVHDGGLDTVTQYELWQGIWHSLEEVNLHELDWALARHNKFLEHFVPFTFVGNHDVTRIASQIGDERHHDHAIVLLFVLGGTPSVYYGDELGLRAVKEERAGGDDAIRPAFPSGSKISLDLGIANADPEVLALHQLLIGVRRRHQWLHTARSRTVSVTNGSIVLEMTGSDPGQAVLVALNLNDDELQVFDPEPGGWITGRDAGLIAGGLSVGPHGWAIVGVRR